jgi:hypothetical protein
MINNSAYHNSLVKVCPTSTSRVKYTEGWLLKHNIPFISDLLMTEVNAAVKLRISMQKRDFLRDFVSQLRCLPSTTTENTRRTPKCHFQFGAQYAFTLQI